jgi:hypothetical protein
VNARLRGEAGFLGGAEVLPFGVLLFVVGSLLLANAWAVVDAKMAVSAAAREAARTYVEADSHPHGLTAAADAAADAVAGHGRNPRRLELEGPADATAFERCTRVEFTARYPIPAVALPWIGGLGGGFTVRATHSEIVDPYREGLGGKADCG